MDNTYSLIKENFTENGISSACYIMRKFKLNFYQADQYIKKLSRYADEIVYDKKGKIISIILNIKE